MPKKQSFQETDGEPTPGNSPRGADNKCILPQHLFPGQNLRSGIRLARPLFMLVIAWGSKRIEGAYSSVSFVKGVTDSFTFADC